MFTKSQQVTFLQSWDDKGTVWFTDLVVHSCGKKQMVLVNDAGEKFAGANFLPSVYQYGVGLVLPRLTQEEAERTALELGGIVAAERREEIPAKIAHYAAMGHADAGYRAAMQKELDALHEPRALRR